MSVGDQRRGHVIFDSLIVGNVAEAGDIVLYVIVLGVTLVVGLALLVIGAGVVRLGERRAGTSRRSPSTRVTRPERRRGSHPSV